MGEHDSVPTRRAVFSPWRSTGTRFRHLIAVSQLNPLRTPHPSARPLPVFLPLTKAAGAWLPWSPCNSPSAPSASAHQPHSLFLLWQAKNNIF